MPFHCTEAFNAKSATCIMFITEPTLSICQVLGQHAQGMLIQSFCYEMWLLNRIKTALFLKCGCECVPRSPVCPAFFSAVYEFSSSRRAWEDTAQNK